MPYLVFVQFGKYYAWIGLIISYGGLIISNGAAAEKWTRTVTHSIYLGTVISWPAVTIATEDIARATVAKRIHTRYPTNTN